MPRPSADAPKGVLSPLPATIFTPSFITLFDAELKHLLNTLRDPLCTQLLLLIVTQSDFKNGQLVASYARLRELCTPHAPERGRRMKGPTQDQVRRALDWLQGCDLIRRDKAENAAQGMLKITVRRRNRPVQKGTSVRKEPKI